MRSFKIGVVKLLTIVAAMLMFGTSTFAQVSVTLPTVGGVTGSTATGAITVGSFSNVYSFQFTVAYDKNVVDLTSVTTAGTLIDGMAAPAVNADLANGKLHVAWASATALSSTGALPLIKLNFTFKTGTSTLTFDPADPFKFNAGTPSVTVTTGSATVPAVPVQGGTINASIGKTFNFPITVTAITDGQSVYSYDFTAHFDPTKITFSSTVNTVGTLSENGSVSINVNNTAGTISFAYAGGSKIVTTGGTLVNLTGTAVNAGTSAFTFDTFKFNTGVSPTSYASSGSVVVYAAPTLTLNPVGPNFSVNEGSALAVQLVGAGGLPASAYSYSYTVSPAIATNAPTLNASTGAFAWTPVTNQYGVYTFTFNVTDGSLTTSVTSVVTVLRVNVAPTLSLNPAGPNFSVNEGAALSVQLVGADANDNTTLVYSYVSTPAATGATFNTATGAFAWTPATNQNGTYNVTFTVSDGSLSTSVSSVITVGKVNLAPSLTLSPAATSYSVNEGETLTITLNGTDPNTGDVLSYSITSPTTLPAGAALASNVFTWTPTFDLGRTAPYSFTFKVADQGGLSATVTASITVVNVNRAPVFTTVLPNNVVVPVHKAPNPVYYRFTYTASDPDGNPLTFSLLAGAANMSVTTDGQFAWAPSLDQAGKSFVVTVQVTDGFSTVTTTATLTASSSITAVEDLGGFPTEFSLMQNYPNPFNPTTSIRFALPKDSDVKLTVFNMLGQEVVTLFNGTLNAGIHKVDFDASKLTSGLYLYRIEAGNFISVKKMLLMK